VSRLVSPELLNGSDQPLKAGFALRKFEVLLCHLPVHHHGFEVRLGSFPREVQHLDLLQSGYIVGLAVLKLLHQPLLVQVPALKPQGGFENGLGLLAPQSGFAVVQVVSF
jgi:hypothetical protein